MGMAEMMCRPKFVVIFFGSSRSGLPPHSTSVTTPPAAPTFELAGTRVPYTQKFIKQGTSSCGVHGKQWCF